MNTFFFILIVLGVLSGWLAFLVMVMMGRQWRRLDIQYMRAVSENRELTAQKMQGQTMALQDMKKKLAMQEHMMVCMAAELMKRGFTPPDADDGEAWTRG